LTKQNLLIGRTLLRVIKRVGEWDRCTCGHGGFLNAIFEHPMDYLSQVENDQDFSDTFL
jgi:hypothetical protein